MDSTGRLLIGIFTAVVTLAIVAVIVSNRANTSSVINAATSGFASILNTVVSPVTGAT